MKIIFTAINKFRNPCVAYLYGNDTLVRIVISFYYYTIIRVYYYYQREFGHSWSFSATRAFTPAEIKTTEEYVMPTVNYLRAKAHRNDKKLIKGLPIY